ncbi:MAG: MerR family transcriptional regulator [Pseudorhodoplanes sp.]
MDKAPDAFRTISEVADDLKVPQHVLRFWESRFNQIKPMKRAGGRRYYRPDDVDLLRGIHHLLYGEGYTIRGVQRILRDQGLKFVQQVWHPDAEQPPHGHFDDDADVPEDEADEAEDVEDTPRAVASAASRPQPAEKAPLRAAFSREDLRKLQAALFELGECRRLLDSVLPESGVEEAPSDAPH